MKTKDSETRYECVWFGASARVTIGPGFLHKTGFGSIVIPHPPVDNRLLRIGLPDYLHRNLSFAHEFAHFKTAPVLFVYMLGMLVYAYVKGRTGMGEILLVFAGIRSAWEIMSEGVVVLEGCAAYRASYNRVTRFPRILFWVAAEMLTAAGWAVLLQG